MVTEPRTDGKRTPLQDFETLYIGGAEPAVSRRVLGGDDGRHKMCKCEQNFEITMARIVLGTGSLEQARG
jgi:hypothetical protein